MLGFTVPIPDVPGLGNTLPVAFFFLCHVTIAEYSVGAITLATAMEAHGARSGDPRALRYAHSLGRSYYLVFSFGATLALFAVVLLTGLWGKQIGTLVNELLPLIGLAFGLFLILTPLLVWYQHSFGAMRPGRHALLGAGVTFWQTLFVVLIVGLDSYLITPDHGGLVETALNPPYLPLLVHRLIGNASWAALFLAGFAALKGRRTEPGPERDFQSWAAGVNLRIGLVLALLMPVDGFILVEVLKHSQLGFFDNLIGSQGGLMVLQEVLVGTILVGGNIALGAEREGGMRASPSALAATVLSGGGMIVACMPAAVLGPDIIGVRYAGLGLAVVATAFHLAARMRPRRPAHGQRPVLLRRSLVTVGAVSVVTALLMGYIKEHARGDYAIYGELRQVDAHGPFDPPRGLYP
ncbi:MAG: hypothetical protein ABR564_08200 [Candidatus Dormibacteria bacterium]